MAITVHRARQELADRHRELVVEIRNHLLQLHPMVEEAIEIENMIERDEHGADLGAVRVQAQTETGVAVTLDN